MDDLGLPLNHTGKPHIGIMVRCLSHLRQLGQSIASPRCSAERYLNENTKTKDYPDVHLVGFKRPQVYQPSFLGCPEKPLNHFFEP